MKKIVIFLFVFICILNFQNTNAQSNNLGCHPRYQTLTPGNPANSDLYGMTEEGGGNNLGVIFKYNVSNNTYTELYDFVSGNGDNNGTHPNGNLYYSSVDGVFYGMTHDGGMNNFGTIFKFNPSNNTYTGLYSFINNENTFDGTFPNGSLINIPINGTTVLYGVTGSGAM